MADTKISALPDATSVNLADELPIVQSGATKRATVAEVHAAARYDTWITGYADNDWIPFQVTGVQGSILSSWGANQILFCPWRPPKSLEVDGIQVYTNSVGGASICAGIYDSDGTNGRPGTRLVDCGTASIAGSAGNRTISFSAYTVPNRWVWIGVVGSATHDISETHKSGLLGFTFPDIASGDVMISFWSAHTYSGTMPSTAPSPTAIDYALGGAIRATGS